MAKWEELRLAMSGELAELRAEAANIAAQRDAAEKRAEVAEERLRAVEARCEALIKYRKAMIEVTFQLREQLDAVLAELARIRAADRTSITVRTTEAAKMRKGQAI